MTYKTLLFMLSASVLLPVLQTPAQDDNVLKIYMPREVTVKGSRLTLGQVGIIRGNETLAAAAGEVELGRLSTPDQSIRIDKNLILSRLACSGFAAAGVMLTGAEETVITREHEVITESRMIEAATEFLKKNLPDSSICQMDTIRTPGPLVLPGETDSIQLICRLMGHGPRNQCKVQVMVLDGNRQVGTKEVYFRFRYNVRKIIAKKAVAQGEVLSTENLGIETAVSNYPEPVGWQAPYGLAAVRPIPANTVVTAQMVSTPEPEVLIKRNQSVSIKIENAGLIASAVGKALQNGVSGDYIKVQNVDSKIIITAKVNHDGTVEPVY